MPVMTFELPPPDDDTQFSESAAESLVGKRTRVEGEDATITAAELTPAGSLSITVTFDIDSLPMWP